MNKRKRSGTATFVANSAAPQGRSWKGKAKSDSVRAIVRQEMKQVVEKKVIEVASATYQLDVVGSLTLINGASTGTDFTNRLGRKYTNVTVQLEGSGQTNVGASARTATKGRVMLIFDAQPNGVLPAITDILTGSTSVAFMNLNNRDRFKVLRDENFVLGPSSAASADFDQTIHNISIFQKINLETICDGTTAGIADINSGAIYLLTIGDGVSGNAFARLATRVRFTDQ